MNIFILKKSTRKEKKMMVITPQGRTIHFGSMGYSDFTKHRDSERRKRYIARHKARENWSNTNTAGFWALHVLWGISPDIKKCISFIQKKFNIKIKIDII
jgi:hypothetical protein